MEVSKTALAVALSTGLLFGCDFDVGPDSGSDGGSDGGTTPTSALVGPLWNFEDASGASTQAIGLPNIYVFNGTDLNYYDDDATPGIYEITTTPYTDDIDGGVVTFTYYDESGNGTEVTGAYTVVDGVLKVDTGSFGELTGTDETTTAEIKAAVEAANADAGFNNVVQILDTMTDDKGELRLKLADSGTNAAVSEIPAGRINVDLIYQVDEDSTQEATDDGNGANISLFGTGGTSNINLHGEIVLNGGEIFYRTNTISDGKPQLSESIGQYTIGEDLSVEVEWADGKYSFTINDTTYDNGGSGYPVVENTPVAVIALKLGDDSRTTHYELLVDNLKVWNIEGSGEELVFEDNFDSYQIGQNLSDNPYNDNSNEAVVINASGGVDEPTDPEEPTDPVDPPEAGDNPTTVDAVNAAIQAAQAGDTVTLAAAGVFSSGVITVDKAITLTAQDGAEITGSACVDVQAPGAIVDGLTFSNTELAVCGNDAVENSTTRGSAIYVGKVGEEANPVELTNLTINGADVETVDNKGPWIRIYGYANVTNSSFTLPSGMQNDGIAFNCSSSKGKLGNVVSGNVFVSDGTSDKETSAVKVGDSSSEKIKSGQECNATVTSNTFTGFAIDQTASIAYSKTQPEPDGSRRNTAIYAVEDGEDILNGDGSVSSAAEASGNSLTGNTFN
ncbi:hypothetical protein AB4525_00575 [Vibrio breoganii]|uniref:hypothetical protein n=1 Tax=Vibrio breoganii TaxID=553239 RepID=UPI000C81FDAE|nr:hypothetical protein [Vibrio breoganii]PMO34685.1 hypothetical protein BCT12_12415 [Vibrio breoganii]PMO54830.1 hypothetical protein BCT07_16100 [Vibrio breoganii]